VHGRFDKQQFRLVSRAERVEFEGDDFRVTFERGDIAGTCRGQAAGPIDLTYFHIMDLMRQAIYESQDVNYVNA
jgi:hypothetical protein